MYEQGWGRVLTFVIAASIYGVYDVTKRYIKEWKFCQERRTEKEVSRANAHILENNEILRKSFNKEKLVLINSRDEIEQQFDLEKQKVIYYLKI